MADKGIIPPTAPDCLKCAYFYVTWDRHYPRGCRLFGVKSMELPSLMVFRATGLHCPSFSLSPKVR